MTDVVDGLLRDKTRPPGIAPVPPERVEEIIRLTLEAPPHEATHWTQRAMAIAVGLSLPRSEREGARAHFPSDTVDAGHDVLPLLVTPCRASWCR